MNIVVILLKFEMIFLSYFMSIDSELYQRLKKYLLTDVQLIENGFPQSDVNCPGTVTIKVSEMEKNYVPLSSANCE